MDERKEIFFFSDAICLFRFFCLLDSSFFFLFCFFFSLFLPYEDEFDSHLPLSLCDMNGHYKPAMTAIRGHWTTPSVCGFPFFPPGVKDLFWFKGISISWLRKRIASPPGYVILRNDVHTQKRWLKRLERNDNFESAVQPSFDAIVFLSGKRRRTFLRHGKFSIAHRVDKISQKKKKNSGYLHIWRFVIGWRLTRWAYRPYDGASNVDTFPSADSSTSEFFQRVPFRNAPPSNRIFGRKKGIPGTCSGTFFILFFLFWSVSSVRIVLTLYHM